MYSYILFIEMLTSSRHEMKWSIVLIDDINILETQVVLS